MYTLFYVGLGVNRPFLGDCETDKRFTDKGIALLPDLDVEFAPKLPDGCHFCFLTVIRL